MADNYFERSRPMGKRVGESLNQFTSQPGVGGVMGAGISKAMQDEGRVEDMWGRQRASQLMDAEFNRAHQSQQMALAPRMMDLEMIKSLGINPRVGMVGTPENIAYNKLLSGYGMGGAARGGEQTGEMQGPPLPTTPPKPQGPQAGFLRSFAHTAIPALGAGVGAGLGGLLGIESGPGALLTGAAGAAGGGYLGNKLVNYLDPSYSELEPNAIGAGLGYVAGGIGGYRGAKSFSKPKVGAAGAGTAAAATAPATATPQPAAAGSAPAAQPQVRIPPQPQPTPAAAAQPTPPQSPISMPSTTGFGMGGATQGAMPLATPNFQGFGMSGPRPGGNGFGQVSSQSLPQAPTAPAPMPMPQPPTLQPPMMQPPYIPSNGTPLPQAQPQNPFGQVGAEQFAQPPVVPPPMPYRPELSMTPDVMQQILQGRVPRYQPPAAGLRDPQRLHLEGRFTGPAL